MQHGRLARAVALCAVAVLIAGCAAPVSTEPGSAASLGTSPTPQSLATASPPPSLEPVSLLLDTDVSPDALVAIAVLLSAPHVTMEAITVSGTGEAHCQGGVDVVLRLLERLDAPPVPVACGRETPLVGDHEFPEAWRAGVDAGSQLDLPATSRDPIAGTAVDLILATADRVDGLRIMTDGPLTNLAEAVLTRPTLAEQVDSVYVMGGAIHVPGNLGPPGPAGNAVAEWNIYIDPRAAAIVLDAGMVVRLVSLDGTSQVPVTPSFADRVDEEAVSPAALVLAELFVRNLFMTDGTFYLWDPLASMLAAGYPVGSFSPVQVTVEEVEGSEVGFTRPGDGIPNVEYLSAVDAAAAEQTLLSTLNRP